MHKTSLKQKIGLILLGIFLCAVFLEIGLRLGGFIILSLREHRNRVSINKRDEYRIMCLGESTTVWGDGYSWPSQLEEILNERNIGIRFKVINKGRHAIETSGILLTLEENLNKYNPDMVITMMGVNDWVGTIPYEDSLIVKIRLFISNFRVYKLTKLLWLHIVNKAEELGFYRKLKGGKINPGNGRSYELGGYREEKTLQAEAMLKKAPELNPPNDVTYTDLGHLYNSQNRYKEAEAMLKKALELNPHNASAYDGLGFLLYNLARFQEAEAMFKKALELDPNSADAYVGLGSCYREEGRTEEVEEIMRKVIEINPKSAGAYIFLGDFYLNLKAYKKAEEMFKKALEINPTFEPIYTDLGRCYRLQGKLKEVQELAKKVMKEKIRNDRLYGFVATSYRDQGKYKEAEEYFKLADEFRLSYYNPATRDNYQRLKETVTQRGIKLVCMQYPLRSVEPLKKLLDSTEDIIFVENRKNFEGALKNRKYEDYFVDNFGGEFGHGSPRGNRLIAENVANIIIKEVFKK